jgi:DNA-binding transcriptional LysR family regulator
MTDPVLQDAPHHGLAQDEVGMPRHPKELGTHDCITFAGLMSPNSWTFKVGKPDMAVAIRSRLVVNTAEAAIDAAVAGIGVTRVLSYRVSQAFRAGTLVVALLVFEAALSPNSSRPAARVARGQEYRW